MMIKRVLQTSDGLLLCWVDRVSRGLENWRLEIEKKNFETREAQDGGSEDDVGADI